MSKNLYKNYKNTTVHPSFQPRGALPGMPHWQSIVGNVRAGAGQSPHQSCSESSNVGPLSEVLLAAMQPRSPACAPSGLTPPACLRTWFENARLVKGEFSSRTLSSALIQCS